MNVLAAVLIGITALAIAMRATTTTRAAVAVLLAAAPVLGVLLDALH